jgi:hypothetical protein
MNMTQTLEMERIIYDFSDDTNDRHEDKLFLAKERKEDVSTWTPIAKGWDYQLWYGIGERGGLAEAEELSVVKDGKEQTVSIEEYIKLCRESLANTLPAEDIFKRFNVHVFGLRKKEMESAYIIKSIEQEYKLEKVNEDAEHIYYEKSITTAEYLLKIPLHWESKEHNIRTVFTEKA